MVAKRRASLQTAASPQDALHSLMDIFGQHFEFFKLLQLLWDSGVRAVSAHVFVPKEPLAQVLVCDVFSQKVRFVKKDRTLLVRARKRCFCVRLFLPFMRTRRSIHKAPSRSDSLHHVNSGRCGVWKNCLAHRAHVGSRHRRNIQFLSVRAFYRLGMHFVRSSCFVRFKKKKPSTSRPLLSSTCIDRPGASPLLQSPGWCRPRRVPATAPVLCLNYIQVDRRDIVSVQLANFSQVSFQFAHKVVAPFLFLQRRDVVLKLLCPRRGIRSQLPIVRHAWVVRKLLPALAGGPCRLFEFALPF